MKYIVFFEIFNKKLKATVDANSSIDAKLKVKEAINIVNVKMADPINYPEPGSRDLKDFFNGIFEDLKK